MWFLNTIVSWLWIVSQYFFHVYTTIHNWPYPFYFIASPFYALGSGFEVLAINFTNFNTWVDYVASKVAQILTISQITSYFSTWINYATTAYYWVRYAWTNVTNVINSWWASTQYIVLAWIEDAKQWAGAQISNLNYWLGNLQVSWNNFTITILPNLATWSGIDSLIISRLKEWFPFYDDLAGLWNDIKLFFTDPLQWLYDRLDEFFERFW